MPDTLAEYITGITPDSTLPVLAPSAGVPGYAARWIASSIEGADGSAVTSWTDFVGGKVLTPLVGSPTLAIDPSGDKYVRLDGTAVLQQGAAFSTALKTLIMLVRLPAAAGALGNGSIGVYGSSGYTWGKGSGSTLDVNAGSVGGGTTLQAPGTALDTWMFLGAVQNGASSIAARDASQVTGTLGTGSNSQLVIGRKVSGGTIYRSDVAEIIGYTDALTGTQLNTVRAALQSNYSIY